MNIEEHQEIEKKVNEIKEEVATRFGYNLEMPTKWEYAMLITSRTKQQLAMYELVIRIIAEDANYHLTASAEKNKAQAENIDDKP